MKTGQLKIDFLTLNETNVVQDSMSSNARSLRLGGIESLCDTATVERLRDNLMSLMDRVVPIQFEYKSSYNGYYRVTDVNVETDKWFNGSVQVSWTMTTEVIGPDNAVDVESRLSNVVRANNFSSTGERWHAPAIGHYAYFTGSSTGTPLTRASENGAITVYRGVPAGVNPTWGSPVNSFFAGRTSFLSGGVEVMGTRQLLPPTGWELNNGLVRVRPATAGSTTLLVAHYDGSTWLEKTYDIRIGTDGTTDALVPATHFLAVNINRRTHEFTSMRIVATQPSNGNRVLVDLVLRRGSRFVEGYVQRTASGDIGVVLDVAEPTTNATGYVRATGEDENGLRFVVGSAKTFTSIAGGITKSATTTLDFFIGAETPSSSFVQINPGFETGTLFGWGTTNVTGTATSSSAKYGTYSAQIIATGAGNAQLNQTITAGAIAGRQYTVSMWLMSPVNVTGGAMTVGINWYTNTPTYINTSVQAAPALVMNVWTPVSATFTAPATTARLSAQAVIVSPATGAQLFIDSVSVRDVINSGDTAATLFAQYIGAMAETTEVVRR